MEKMSTQLSLWKEGINVKVKLICQKSSMLQRDDLEKCLKFMHGMIVMVGCTVELTCFRTAKLKGIHSCIVLSCFTESGEVNNDVPVRISKSTVINIVEVQSYDAYKLVQARQRRESSVGGLDEERTILAKLLSTRAFRSPAVLIKGPPGCGKSSLVEQVAADCDAALLTVLGSQLVNSDPEDTETCLASVFQKAEKLSEEVPCILFFDKLEALCSKSEKRGSNGSVAEALCSHLKRISRVNLRHGFLVIMATNQPTQMDPSLLKHDILARKISLSVPSTKQRRQILDLYLKGLPLSDDVDVDKLSTMMSGCVGNDIRVMCSQAAVLALKRRILTASNSNRSECKVTMADFEEECRHFKPSMLRGEDSFVDVRPVEWSDIGGLDDVKMQIQQAVEWPLMYAEEFQALGLPLTKGVLLTGPPGCGKTTLARAAATACHVTFLSLSCAQIYSPYVGASEKKISETFHKARALAPSILFLDEIDAIVGKRSDSGSSVSERVLSTLLNEMDGVGVRVDGAKGRRVTREMAVEGEAGEPHATQTISARELMQEERDRHVLVMAATNRPDMIDNALTRPGRIDRIIHVPPPDLKGRQQAFVVHSKGMPLAGDVDLDDLARRSQHCSGADIRGICTEAGIFALTEDPDAQSVSRRHFDMALALFSCGQDG